MELGPGICHSVTPMVRSSASGWRAATRCIRLIHRLHNVALAAYAYQRGVSFVLASKRSVFGLAELAPLRDGVAPARHAEPGRGRGRPPIIAAEEEVIGPQPPLLSLTPLERRSFNYSTAGVAHRKLGDPTQSRLIRVVPVSIEHAKYPIIISAFSQCLGKCHYARGIGAGR